jgi:hypothetical protein
MKSKLKGALGIGFALVLVASLMLFALPAAAGPYEDLQPPLPNMWTGFAPQPGLLGLWFFDPAITQVGPIAQAINGDIYAHVAGATANGNDIFKSTNGGRTWSVSAVPAYYTGGAVVDMVCSSKSEDVLYLTDGNYVYKSINGATTFTLVAAADLEYQLMGACGTPITGLPITCIDVGYDSAGKPIVLIGTRYVTPHVGPDANPAVGSVYYIADETFSATWTNLQLGCYPCCGWAGGSAAGCYDVYSVAAAPGFDSVSKVYAVITAPLTSITFTVNTAAQVEIRAGDQGATFTYAGAPAGVTCSAGATPVTLVAATPNTTCTFDATAANAGGTVTIAVTEGTISWRLVSGGGVTICGGTHMVSTLGTVCNWTHIHELAWNCLWSFEIEHASHMMFPSYYATEAAIFVGVAAVIDNDGSSPGGYDYWGEGGDVYRVTDAGLLSDCIDLNIQGFTTGCLGFNHANICSLDIDNDQLAAGAWNEYQLQSPTRVYYSADGGWTWAASKKDPTGEDRTYVLFGSSIVAATRGCDCAFSLSCGAAMGDFFNQISLISMDVDEVLDMTHAPGYVFDSQIMYVLTSSADACCGDAFMLTASAGTSAATVVEGTGTVSVTVFNENGTVTTTITEAPVGTFTIDFGDAGDAVLVTALTTGTVTWTQTAPTVTATEVIDCDFDMTVGASGVAFAMDGVTEIRSLLRWDGTWWERVHSSRYYVVASTQATSMFWFTPLYDWVEVSPDFNSTDCVYMANTGFYMTRSIDAGCSWATLVYPCFDRPTISAWIVVDEDTVLASGCGTGTYSGFVYRTTNHGAQPWSSYMVKNTAKAFACCGVDFDLSLPRAADSDVLLGDACGQVFLSQDLGETWVEVYDTTTHAFAGASDQTYVVFDPGYGTAGDPGENTFYAAGGDDIGRCAYNAEALPFKQNWVYICPAAATCETCDLYRASGIDAVGDTVLYVADAGGGSDVPASVIVSGTVEICCYACAYAADCCGDFTFDEETVHPTGDISFITGELVSITGWNLVCTTTCDDDVCTFTVTGQIDIMGLSSGAVGYISFTNESPTTFYCATCSCEGITEICSSIATVLSAHLVVTTGGGTSAALTGVWRSVNPLDPMPPAYPALVEWEFLVRGTAGPHMLLHPEADALGIYPDDLWVTAASNMLWALDWVGDSSPTDYIWMWDDPLAAPVIQVSPADGALLATSTTATLEWEALDAATEYEVKVYEECPECLNPNEMKLFGTFYTTVAGETCIKITGLTAGTKYFWKVRVSCNHPQVSKWSDLRSFDTALSLVDYCSPICGAEDISLTPNFSWYAVTGATSYEIEVSTTEDFATVLASGTPTINAWDGIPQLDYSTTYYWRVRAVKDGVYSGWTYCLFSTIAEPEAPPEPVEPVIIEQSEITPTWIWVIIGIGGALTIAVIILIVTTRRVP